MITTKISITLAVALLATLLVTTVGVSQIQQVRAEYDTSFDMVISIKS
jgi:hypothetical protein